MSDFMYTYITGTLNTLTLVEGNYYITVQDFTENESRFNVRGIMYTKEVHVTRPY